MNRLDPTLRIGEVNSPFSSATILPLQFCELLQRSAARSPEISLMAAVLHDAIRSHCKSNGSRRMRSRKLFGETSEWFASRDDGWPFAFENICAVLGLEPEWIRRVLSRWQGTVSGGDSRRTTIPRLRLRDAGNRVPAGPGRTGIAA